MFTANHHHTLRPRLFYEQALNILSSCECHIGSLCRTAFALARAHKHSGNSAQYDKYVQLGSAKRLQIESNGSNGTPSLGVIPENYDIFVQVGLR